MGAKNKLDGASLEILREGIDPKKYDSWYELSSRVFPSSPITSETQLLHAVSAAYSWMPTVPSWHGENLDWERAESKLNSLTVRDRGSVKDVFESLVPVVNYSIIGLSKALHFSYPKILPIIDSNVVAAWIDHFDAIDGKRKCKNEPAYLPATFNCNMREKNRRLLHISYYSDYAYSMQVWSEISGESIRDIEKSLYLRGAGMPTKKKRGKASSTEAPGPFRDEASEG